MKDKIKEIKEAFNNEDNSSKKAILFFGFYFIFFLVLALVIIFLGKDDYLLQEYERGNTAASPEGYFSNSYLYDYKVTIDGVLHDYYGKKYNDQESFKYNNLDYYHENDDFFVKNDQWIKCDNPYKYYEFLTIESASLMLQNATLMNAGEKQDEEDLSKYNYLISSNTINKIIYNLDTDYDEVPDSIDMYTDTKNRITKIVFKLDHLCSHRDDCNNSLTIEMNFEMIGEVQKIDNPTK